jgi:hypothetical protein
MSLIFLLYVGAPLQYFCCIATGAACIKPVQHTDPTDPDADSEHWYIYIILQRYERIF